MLDKLKNILNEIYTQSKGSALPNPQILELAKRCSKGETC